MRADDDEPVAGPDGLTEVGVGERRLLALADAGADERRADAVDEPRAVPLGGGRSPRTLGRLSYAQH